MAAQVLQHGNIAAGNLQHGVVSSHLAAAASRAGHTWGAAQLLVPQASSKPQGSHRLPPSGEAPALGESPGGRVQEGPAVEVDCGTLQARYLVIDGWLLYARLAGDSQCTIHTAHMRCVPPSEVLIVCCTACACAWFGACMQQHWPLPGVGGVHGHCRLQCGPGHMVGGVGGGPTGRALGMRICLLQHASRDPAGAAFGGLCPARQLGGALSSCYTAPV
jgi:hypothetical protein